MESVAALDFIPTIHCCTWAESMFYSYYTWGDERGKGARCSCKEANAFGRMANSARQTLPYKEGVSTVFTTLSGLNLESRRQEQLGVWGDKESHED